MAKEINLKELYLVIKNRLWMILVITLLTTLAGYLYGKMTATLVYQSSTRMIVSANSDQMSTLLVMIKDPIVLDKVKQELNLPQSSGALASQLSVNVVNGSQVVNLSVVDPNEQQAISIANATAKIFKEQMADVLNFNGIQLLTEPKSAIPIASNPNSKRTLGLIAGLVLGIGLVFLMDSLDESIKKDREVEDILGLPLLGKVSKMNKKNIRKKRLTQLEITIRGESIGSK